MVATLEWKNDALVLLDQRVLPKEIKMITCKTCLEVIAAIKDMVVRGAPAIGATAGFGFVFAAKESTAASMTDFVQHLEKAKDELFAARPTAVNLQWALDRQMRLTHQLAEAGSTVPDAQARLLEVAVLSIHPTADQEAHAICEEDVKINKTMADHGAALVKQGAKVLHHCNTGALATVDWGTALGVIHTAHLQKKDIHVWVDETRPRLQGARLTAWELTQWNVPFKLIPDSASGLLMQRGEVDIILVGADRIAANGDTANKVGTYNLAAVANDNKVPMYIVAPTSTVDLDTPTGAEIPIEERVSTEVTHVGSEQIAPDGCPVFNPAFDVTPNRLLKGIVTEVGVAYPPFTESLAQLVAKARATGPGPAAKRARTD